MDDAKIKKLCQEIAKKEGKGSIFVAGKGTAMEIPKFSSGIEDLDALLGGGIPKGRIIEIFGAESSGKTSLGYWLMSQVKRGLYIPIEGTYDEDRAFQIGVQVGQMIVHRANYGEEAVNDIINFAKAGIPLIILDSVAACQPREDVEKIEKDAANETRMGGTARLFSKTLPSIQRICEETGTSVILINQVRDKIGAMMFGDKDDTPGGRAIKFYSSVRIKVARRAWIEIPNKNPQVTANNEKVGIVMKCRVVKSKISNPYGEAELPFFFDRGFVSFDDVPDIRKELMAQRRAEFNV